MKQFLSKVIVDPVDQGKLELKKGWLEGMGSGRKYKLWEGIPILLAKGKNLPPPSIHLDKGFDYATHYQKDAEVFDYFKTNEDGATLHENRRLHEAIINEVGEKVSLILDVGCGNAWVSKHFCKKGVQVISMDISTANPKKALQQNPSENHAGLVADAYYLPISDNTIECIIASEIMEHVPDPKWFIRRLLAAISSGGTLLVTTPYNEKLRHHLCIHCNCPTPENAHLHSFDENNIWQYLPQEGTVVSIKKFSNLLLNKVKSFKLLQYLPFKVWWLIDALANKLIKKETRLMIKIQKSEKE